MGTVACMKDLSIFAELSAEEKRRVTELARKKTYKTGATRVMVSHALKRLRGDGLVDFDGEYYYLLRPE